VIDWEIAMSVVVGIVIARFMISMYYYVHRVMAERRAGKRVQDMIDAKRRAR
jgi:hypothetical protein